MPQMQKASLSPAQYQPVALSWLDLLYFGWIYIGFVGGAVPLVTVPLRQISIPVRLSRCLSKAGARARCLVERTMPWDRTDLRNKGRFSPKMRTMLLVFIVFAVVVAGWLFGAMLTSRYLLH